MKTSNKILLGALALVLLFIVVTLVIFKSTLSNNEWADNIPGIQKTEVLQNIVPFNRIRIEGKVSVYYTQDTFLKVEVKADSSLIRSLHAEVNDGELRLRTNLNFRKQSRINVFVTTDSINKVYADAGGTFKTMKKIKASRFDSEGNAGGIFTVYGDFTNMDLTMDAGAIGNFEGTCENMKINSNAGAIINAEKMAARNATISTSTGAISNIFVTGELSVFASTGSIIKCHGDPSVKQSEVSTGAMFSK